MRKLLMVAMMLLVPALANAWVLAVKVTNTSAGIAGGNKATVSVGGILPGTDVSAGSSYFYPTNTPLQSVQVVVANKADATVTLGGVAATPDVAGGNTYTIAANAGKTLQTLGVVYGTTATAVKQNITLSSGLGGVSAIKIGAALSPSGFTNVIPGTAFDIVAQPNVGYKVTSIKIEGIERLAAASTAKTTITSAVVSGEATDVVVSYAVNPQATLVLAAPPSAASGVQVHATAQASSNVAGVSYSFTTNCTSPATNQAAGSSNLFYFTPDGSASSCQVSATVYNGATALDTKSTTVAVTNGTAAANQTCTGCHAGSTPAIVTAYNNSKHKTSGKTCVDCHTEAAHTTLTTVATCENCHAATLSTTTHPVALTASKCLSCHDSHNPGAGIANLGPAPAHPAVTLYTFEEIGMQMANGAKVPVQVDANGKGMPYSPKQTCGTAGCHVKNGVDYTYDKISDHAFHSNQGRSEYVDSSSGKFDATKSKPWTQSTAMVGKW